MYDMHDNDLRLRHTHTHTHTSHTQTQAIPVLNAPESFCQSCLQSRHDTASLCPNALDSIHRTFETLGDVIVRVQSDAVFVYFFIFISCCY